MDLENNDINLPRASAIGFAEVALVMRSSMLVAHRAEIAPDSERSARVMSTYHPTVQPAHVRSGTRARETQQWRWIAAGLVFAFAVPYLLADLIGLDRDLFYGAYALAVVAFLTAWLHSTSTPVSPWLTRNWQWGVALGIVFAAVMAITVLRTEAATTRPGGLELAAAIAWRGVVYGIADGLLLSVFPILAVFAAFDDGQPHRLRRKFLVGACAMLVSIGFTTVYHLGYQDFRSSKVRKPITGDVIWSAPTLLTLSPLGAPIAHVGLHVSAVLHSYNTDTFLPPHQR